MLVNIADKSFRLFFRYYISELELSKKLSDVRVTEANFCDPIDPKLTYFLGIAMCSPKDNFTKARGRKLAISRAIQNLPVSDRVKVWQQIIEKIHLI